MARSSGPSAGVCSGTAQVLQVQDFARYPANDAAPAVRAQEAPRGPDPSWACVAEP